MAKIIPFHCTKCNREYSPEEGGICSICHQPFCPFHLYKATMGTEAIYVCEDHKKEFPNAEKMETIGDFKLSGTVGRLLIAAAILMLVGSVLYLMK